MALEHATPGSVIDLKTFGEQRTTAVVKQPEFEVLRVVVKPEKPFPEHKVDGPITVQCLSGSCTFFVEDEPNPLTPGSWLFLSGGTLHTLESQEECVLLVTILFNSK